MDLEFFGDWDDINDDDTLSSGSLDYDGLDNWPLHADCKFDLTDAGKEAWVLSPRSLRNLSALKSVRCGLVHSLHYTDVPKDLYQTLFVEACRLKCGRTIATLVSTWPHPILDLRDVEIPLDCYRGYYTKAVGTDKSLVAMVIDGLLRLEQGSRLKKVILPESEAEGAGLMKAFLLLPATVLQDVPWEIRQRWLTAKTQVKGVLGVWKHAVLPAFDPKQFHRDPSSSVMISIPGVIQWLGRYANHYEVLLGLALASYTPFVFHFERISVCNSRNMDVIQDILKLISRPELVRRLTFIDRMDGLRHAYYYLDTLVEPLKRFTSLESFISNVAGLHVYNSFPANFNFPSMLSSVSDLFSLWPNLQEIDLGGNILLGSIGKMLQSLSQPLRKLNLSATDLTKHDLTHLAQSHHASALTQLNLDHNDLHRHREAVKILFQNLTSVVSLRTCNCRLNHQDCATFAAALSHSQTLKTWNLLQNRLSSLSEIRYFVNQCSKIPSLKEVGCRPVEMFPGFYIHTNSSAVLTEEERQQLLDLATHFNLMVF